MRNFQQKNRFRNILQSRPVLFLLGILVIFFAWGVNGLLSRMRVAVETRELLEARVVELRKEKERLYSDIEKLKTETGIEENIRQKFGLAKEGERMIIIVEDQNKPVNTTTKQDDFFSFFKNLFK